MSPVLKFLISIKVCSVSLILGNFFGPDFFIKGIIFRFLVKAARFLCSEKWSLASEATHAACTVEDFLVEYPGTIDQVR